MPDYQDMLPFTRWWETKGWWLARKLNLDQETIEKIWNEGYLDGITGPRYGNRWTESD